MMTRAKLTTPVNGPGYTLSKPPRKRPGTVTPNDAQRQWSSGKLVDIAPNPLLAHTKAHGAAIASDGLPDFMTRPAYDGAELRVNPGTLPERLEAFKLPSRIGNKLHYPGGRVEVLA